MAKGILNQKGSILQIPLSPGGAVELGLCPCEGCRLAADARFEQYDCTEDCRWWKRYRDEERGSK